MEIKNLIVGPISTNCFLIFSGQEVAVIDPGGNPEKILQEIKKSGNILKYIILTHSHLDHISAAQEIKQKTGAKILTHEVEKYSLNFEPDILLKERGEIKIGDVALKVLHTPGHTPGSICLLGRHPPATLPAEGGAPNFVFTGDTLFKEGIGRTDLPGGSSKHLRESLEKLSKYLKPGMKIYPGHGEIFEYQKL